MNILNKVTLQSLKRNRTRTIVTIIGVILSVAMITAVTTFIASLQNYLLQNEIAKAGGWHVAFQGVDSAFAEKVGAESEVENAARVQNVGYALLEGSENEYKPYLFIAGFDEKTVDMLPVALLSGRMPQNSGEIVLSDHIEKNGGVAYAVGDTLTLDVGDRVWDGKAPGQNTSYQPGEDGEIPAENFQPRASKTYTVVGICARPAFEPFDAPGYTVITGQDAQSGAGYDLYLTLKHPSKVYKFAEENAASADYAFNNDVLRFSGVSNDNMFTTTIYSLGAILIALIMVGSVLLIYNSFSISVSERSRQFGILSSVGATRKQLRRSVLFEGFLIGIIGIVPGLFVGVAGIGVTLRLISGTFEKVVQDSSALTLSVSIPAIVIAAVIGMITILLSAYIPARKAAGRSAIDSIRQTDDVKIKPKALKTSKLTQRLFGLEGTLARKNFKRNKKRYRSTVLSLFVSVVLFISANAFGMYLQQGMSQSVSNTGFDLDVYAPKLSEQENLQLYEKLKNATGVTGSGYFTEVSLISNVPEDALSDEFKSYMDLDETAGVDLELGARIYVVDDDTYERYVEELGLPIGDYTGENATFIAAMKMSTGGNGEKYGSVDIIKGSSVSLQIASADDFTEESGYGQAKWEAIDVTLADYLPKTISMGRVQDAVIVVPYSLKSQFDFLNFDFHGSDVPDLTFLSSDPMKTAADMEQIIKETTGLAEGSGYYITNMAEELEQNRSIILVVNVFTYGFVVLISLIAIANVFNTVSTGISLRRREFAMLRSVGMTDRGFNRMMNYECIFYGLKALAFALPVAAAITYLIYRAMMNGVNIAFSLPWASIGISVLSVFLVVFVTMLYAVGKVKKANVIDTLRDDLA